MQTQTDIRGQQKLLLSIPEACEITGISRSRLYNEMTAGRLNWVKVGTRRLIKPADLQAFVDALTMR